MLKVILAPVDGSNYTKITEDYLIFFHKYWDSEIILQHVIDIIALEGPFFHDLSGAISMEPLVNFTGKIKELLEEQGKIVLENSCNKMREKNVPCRLFLDSGIVSEEIVERAKIADLIIMGKRGIHAKFGKEKIGSTAEGVLRRTPASVLVVPDKYIEIKKPLLAYDGGKVAKKAMELAANFCEKLSLPLSVVTVNSSSKAEKILEEAKTYLTPFNLDVEYIPLEGSPYHEIEQIVKQEGFDLLVMGAVGHHFLIEMIIGSTALHLLRKLDIPFMLCR